MTISQFKRIYLNRLSAWAGVRVNLQDEFDLLCQCDLDFIEFLLIGEKEFEVNFLESNMNRKDFSTINDFLMRASIQLERTDMEYSSRNRQFPYYFKLQ